MISNYKRSRNLQHRVMQHRCIVAFVASTLPRLWLGRFQSFSALDLAIIGTVMSRGAVAFGDRLSLCVKVK